LRSFARTAINASLYIVYIDAEFSLRVKRESDRLGVPVTDIEQKIRLKDAEKTIHGSQEIKNIADVVLNNNGSEAEYFDWIDDFAVRIISLYPSSGNSTSVEYL
jgi:cytidylate kinase